MATTTALRTPLKATWTTVPISIVWREARLSAAGLTARTEALLSHGCFGRAGLAAFWRDMQAVKTALAAAVYTLHYSRHQQ